MINVWSVAQLLEDTGILNEDEVKRAMPFCLSACANLSKRLKAPEYEDEPAVISACAGIAIYGYSLLQSSSTEDFSSFKAGDITISRSSSSAMESAIKFRDEALLMASDYLTDTDFVFRAVDI